MMPSTTGNSAERGMWALLDLIADPEKAKATLASLANARAAADKRVQDAAAKEEEIKNREIEVAKREAGVTTVEAAQTQSAKELATGKAALQQSQEDFAAVYKVKTADLIAQEATISVDAHALDLREKNIVAREAAIAAREQVAADKEAEAGAMVTKLQAALQS